VRTVKAEIVNPEVQELISILNADVENTLDYVEDNADWISQFDHLPKEEGYRQAFDNRVPKSVRHLMGIVGWDEADLAEHLMYRNDDIASAIDYYEGPNLDTEFLIGSYSLGGEEEIQLEEDIARRLKALTLEEFKQVEYGVSDGTIDSRREFVYVSAPVGVLFTVPYTDVVKILEDQAEEEGIDSRKYKPADEDVVIELSNRGHGYRIYSMDHLDISDSGSRQLSEEDLIEKALSYMKSVVGYETNLWISIDTSFSPVDYKSYQYDRADFKADYARTSSAKAPKVLVDVINISCGKLSTLTGLQRYEDLDAVGYAWADLEKQSPTEGTWMDSWERFKDILLADIKTSSTKKASRFSVALASYLEGSLWATSDSSDDSNNPEKLDENYTIDDFAPEAIKQAEKDVNDFFEKASDLLDKTDLPDERTGFLFFLNRNGHGSGFWDETKYVYDQETRDALSDIAESFRESEPYVGDDGLLYFFPHN